MKTAQPASHRSLFSIILWGVVGLFLIAVAIGVWYFVKITTAISNLPDYKQRVEAALQTSANTDPQHIIAHIKKSTSCPPVYPDSKTISRTLILDEYQKDHKSNSAILNMDADKFPQLDFEKYPLFLYQDRLYLAKINYQNQTDVKNLETISPYLAQKLLSCYFTQQNIALIPHLLVEDHEANSQQLKPTLEREISEITAILQQSNLSAEQRADLTKKKLGREEQLASLDMQIGYFKIPDTITLLLSDKHNASPERYVQTLTHEYMHFNVANAGRRLDRFWYDGLADYFTTEVLAKSGRQYDGSYIAAIDIIKNMMQDIPEDVFKEFYFSNDQAKLEQRIDATYGTGFYEAHRELFQTVAAQLSQESGAAHETILKDLEAARQK